MTAPTGFVGHFGTQQFPTGWVVTFTDSHGNCHVFSTPCASAEVAKAQAEGLQRRYNAAATRQGKPVTYGPNRKEGGE